jgi:hypothetical protein
MARILKLSSSGKGLNEGEPYQICSPDAAAAESGASAPSPDYTAFHPGYSFGSGSSGLRVQKLQKYLSLS